MRKTAGLEEKMAATQRKMQVAFSILERRKSNIPVALDRRKRESFQTSLIAHAFHGFNNATR